MRLGSVAGDLQGYSIERIRNACKKYRTNGENKFFPTSGQIIDLIKNPFDMPRGKTYAPIERFDGPQVTLERAREILRKYGFTPSPDATMEDMTQTVLQKARATL